MTDRPRHSSASLAPSAAGTRASWRVLTTRALAGSLLFLGLLTLAGWHLGNDRLIHWRMDWVPMAYNTALGFVVIGASLLAAAFHQQQLSRFLAVIPFLLGILTLYQHLSGISLNLDEWMVAASTSVGAQSPTRVALSTGFCFLLTGWSLLLINRKTLPAACSITINLLSCIVLGIALAAMAGFLQGLTPEQAWGRFNLMAFHSALAFALANAALLLWLQKRNPPSPTHPSPLPAIAGGMAIFTLTLIFTQTLKNEESQTFQTKCSDAANLAANSWTNQLHHYASSLQFIAEVWQEEGPLSQRQFEQLAGIIVGRHRDLQALQWLDPEGIVRWCVPVQGNEAIIGQPGAFEPARRKAWEQARLESSLVLTESISLKQGGLGFLMYLPVQRQGNFDGTLAGVFRYADLAQSQWSQFAGLFEVRLRDVHAGQQPVFPHDAPPGIVVHGYTQTRDIYFRNAHWQLEVTPRREMLSRSLSLLPRVVLGGGGVMGVLTGWLIYLLQAAAHASRELRRANELLQADIAERHRAEQALLEREAGLKLAQRVGNIGSWELDLTTQQLTWSDQTYRIFGLSPASFTPSRDHFYHFVHPEDRQPLRDRMQFLIREGNAFDHEFRVILADGRERILHEQAAPVVMPHSGAVKVIGVVRDITESRLAQQEREKLIVELQEALENVKTLSGLLPICANCKKIRDDQGYWNQIEVYLQKHSDAQFTHGLCPECVRKLYPELYDVPLPGESSRQEQPPAQPSP